MRKKDSFEDVITYKLVENGSMHTRFYKRYFYLYADRFREEYNFDVYTCSKCGIKEWNGKPIIMELDHLNGITNDGRLENLSMKCPNCHSQTPNYKNRKVSIEKRLENMKGN